MQRVEFLVETPDVKRIRDLAQDLHGSEGLGLSQSCQVIVSAVLDGSFVLRKKRASKPEPSESNEE